MFYNTNVTNAPNKDPQYNIVHIIIIVICDSLKGNRLVKPGKFNCENCEIKFLEFLQHG